MGKKEREKERRKDVAAEMVNRRNERLHVDSLRKTWRKDIRVVKREWRERRWERK